MFRIDRTRVNISSSPALKTNVSAEAGYAAAAEEDAESRVAEITERVAVEAQLILQNAELEAAELSRQAWIGGYQDGKAEAAAEAERQRGRDAETISRLLAEIDGERTRILDEAEAEIIELTLAMVKKIINFAEETDDKIFESMIVKALKKMKTEERVTIRVSSAEYEKYFSSGGAAFVLGEDTVTADVLQDSSLNPWDCVIDTRSGTVNVGLDSQLSRIRIAFGEAGEA